MTARHSAGRLSILFALAVGTADLSILWYTRYFGRAVAALRGTEDVPDELLKHLSPSGWEHVNLTGDYIWAAADEGDGMGDRKNGFRPLRSAPEANLLAE